MKNHIILPLIAIAGLLFSCSATKKIEALKPEPSDNSPVVYETTTSFINMPVSITVADIEAQVNKYFNGLIYEDNNISDDEIAMKVWKTGSIKLSEQKGKLVTVVPIKVQAKIKYGTSALGINMYDTRQFDLDAVVTFNSSVGLTNWKMATNTILENLKWKESPTVTIAGNKVAITYLINPAVKLFKSRLETELDKAIENVADFKPQVLDALETLSTPFLTNEQYETWFKVNPVELYVTDAVLAKGRITMDMGLKCTMETRVGQKPENNFKKDKVALKAVTKMPDKINAVVAAVSTYESASKVITKNFQGAGVWLRKQKGYCTKS